ncbi:winged helix-turn-helix domain-containing protein [Gracilibacillus sp. Marseille-QA3620]
MDTVKFSPNDYKVNYHSEVIVFLPKEFQLFKFLYQNPSRIFTRDELLDAVWSLETPIDRTIDDHIYRVRKKIQPLAPAILIETVRGQGYRLVTKKEPDNPLIHEKDITSHFLSLYHKYHLYGQGDALKLLEDNQTLLGFELDLPSQMYLQFMKGNFAWFLEKENIPFWEKCYYYLHIFSFAELDKQKCLDYFCRALSSKELPEHHRLEITLLNRLSFLIFTKQTDEALHLLIQSKQEIHEKRLVGFLPILALLEGYLVLLQKDSRLMEDTMIDISKTLSTYPYAREQASCTVLQGIFCFVKNDFVNGEKYVDKGFQLSHKAKYIPGILINLQVILFFLEEFNLYGRLYTHYQEMLAKYHREYKLPDLKTKIEFQLKSHFQ